MAIKGATNINCFKMRDRQALGKRNIMALEMLNQHKHKRQITEML